MILDCKMPRMNGVETLCWIRARPAFKKLITIMFSGSGQEKDIETAYAAGINSYIVKPHGLNETCHVLQTINAYWFGVNFPPLSLSVGSFTS